MQPDATVQLQAVIKALQFVVAPAISADDRPAAEQLHVSIETLRIVQDHLPFSRRAARQEMTNAISLADALRDLVAKPASARELDQALALARDALLDPAVENGELVRCAGELLTAISAITMDDGGFKNETDAARVILEQSKAPIDLARAWYKSAGFEPDAASLPALDQLFSNDR